MRVHRRQLLCRCHTCFLMGRSRAKPEQSCCSFRAIRSMFRPASDDTFAEQVDVKPGGLGHFHLFSFLVSAAGPDADIHNPSAMTFNPGVEGSSPSALTIDYIIIAL